MALKAKLVGLLEKSLLAHVGKSCKLAENIAGDLIANGVRLESEQATSDKASGWISVKDGLPEESGEYLAYCGEYDGICVLYYEILKTKVKWRSKWKEVTHWMPLPQPPEGE